MWAFTTNIEIKVHELCLPTINSISTMNRHDVVGVRKEKVILIAHNRHKAKNLWMTLAIWLLGLRVVPITSHAKGKQSKVSLAMKQWYRLEVSYGWNEDYATSVRK